MGAAGSVPANDDNKDKNSNVVVALPTKFKESTNSADIFAKEMYLSTPKDDALKHVLSEEAGREAFMNFLRTEYASENLEFFSVRKLLRHESMPCMHAVHTTNLQSSGYFWCV